MKYEAEPRDVRRAMREYDRIGGTAFFAKYGGGRSKRYHVVHPDDTTKRYPSAAIAQAAMAWDDVRGGYDNPYSACPLLERAGFTIFDSDDEPSQPNQVAQRLLHESIDAAKALSDTERFAIVVQRLGQSKLRAELLTRGEGTCEVTGLSDEELLRASHIKPWSKCNDFERLDPDNALLLSALWDAAFDRGLVTFDEEGKPVYSAYLSKEARKQLQKLASPTLRPGDSQQGYLAWHRRNVFRP